MRTSRIAVAAALFGTLVLASPTTAQTAQPTTMVHEDHFLTFSGPIALPDGVTLSAGTYLFHVPMENRRITQVFTEDRTRIYSTLLTQPVVRERAEHFDVVFAEGPSNRPPLLKAWYCDGNRTGHEFVTRK